MCHSLPTALFATWSLQFQPMERIILLSGWLIQEYSRPLLDQTANELFSSEKMMVGLSSLGIFKGNKTKKTFIFIHYLICDYCLCDFKNILSPHYIPKLVDYQVVVCVQSIFDWINEEMDFSLWITINDLDSKPWKWKGVFQTKQNKKVITSLNETWTFVSNFIFKSLSFYLVWIWNMAKFQSQIFTHPKVAGLF